MALSKLAGIAFALGLLTAAGCSSSGAHSVARPVGQFEDAVERKAIVAIMTATAEWQLANPSRHPRYDWTQAPFWLGLASFAPLSSNPQRYLSAVRRNGEENRWRPGPRPLLADDHAITQSYFVLQRGEQGRSMIEPALRTFDAVIRSPIEESLEFSWEKTSRQWVWCDALFMSPPALAMASKATGDRRYLDFMNRMWWRTSDYLYDKEERLYYRDSRFFDQRAPNGRKIFWSRGNGWVLAGLARVLQEMPPDFAERGRYLTQFREMAARIAQLQPSDGYWRTSLLDPDAHPRPETSGTAFYVYALAWGVNEGHLERAAYEPVVRKGWVALVRAVQSNGMLGYVQRIGDQPGETSASGTEIYGVGAFLLAGSEVHRLAQP